MHANIRTALRIIFAVENVAGFCTRTISTFFLLEVTPLRREGVAPTSSVPSPSALGHRHQFPLGSPALPLFYTKWPLLQGLRSARKVGEARFSTFSTLRSISL